MKAKLIYQQCSGIMDDKCTWMAEIKTKKDAKYFCPSCGSKVQYFQVKEKK